MIKIMFAVDAFISPGGSGGGVELELEFEGCHAPFSRMFMRNYPYQNPIVTRVLNPIQKIVTRIAFLNKPISNVRQMGMSFVN